MVTGINDRYQQKILTKDILSKVKVSLMVANVNQIKSGIIINVGVIGNSQKNIIH